VIQIDNEQLDWVSELSIIREYLGHHQILSRPRFSHFLVSIGVVFFPFYVERSMLPASLDCPFLFVHLIFSNVYLKLVIQYYSVYCVFCNICYGRGLSTLFSLCLILLFFLTSIRYVYSNFKVDIRDAFLKS
jgi:hypothetical protein